MSEHRLTYRGAGVDVEAGEGFVRAIAQSVKSTYETQKGRVLTGGADFAGLFRLGEGYEDPVLVSGADGVGTKLLLAQGCARHDTVGVDLVAMCVNDVLTSGAEPLFFLDYIATGKLDEGTLAEVVAGIAAGCREAGCVLIGGETAEMPDLYSPGVYDLAGFAVGVVERASLEEGSPPRAGDAILGLPSSGIHSNGYSLVRKIFASQEKRAAAERSLGVPLDDVLLEPTRIYARGAAVARKEPGVGGVAHVTGGGLPGNVGRVLPEGLQAVFRPSAWNVPDIFSVISALGPVETAEMYRTFNMGLGFVFIVRAERVDALREALAEAGEEALLVGEVVKRPKGAAAVRIEGV